MTCDGRSRWEQEIRGIGNSGACMGAMRKKCACAKLPHCVVLRCDALRCAVLGCAALEVVCRDQKQGQGKTTRQLGHT